MLELEGVTLELDGAMLELERATLDDDGTNGLVDHPTQRTSSTERKFFFGCVPFISPLTSHVNLVTFFLLRVTSSAHEG